MPAGATDYHRPAVLCLSGLDPSGGAGLQADIETIQALGARALTIATCLTVQDHDDLRRVEPVDTTLLREQFDCLLERARFDAIKIGAIADRDTVAALCDMLSAVGDRPLVLDPVLHAGGGTAFSDPLVVEDIRQSLLPITDLLAPNADEALQLADSGGTDASTAAAMLSRECRGSVLLTDRDNAGDSVVSELWQAGKRLQQWSTARRPGRYRGTGCRLSSAIASGLAQGLAVEPAIAIARQHLEQIIDAACIPQVDDAAEQLRTSR